MKLKTYEIEIQATVTKVMTIKSTNADSAESLAHELFSLLITDDIPEKYEQVTKHIGRVVS